MAQRKKRQGQKPKPVFRGQIETKLQQHPHLAGAVNLTPGAIPSKATY